MKLQTYVECLRASQIIPALFMSGRTLGLPLLCVLLREEALLRVLISILEGFEGTEAEQGLNWGFCLSTFSLKLLCFLEIQILGVLTWSALEGNRSGLR